MKYPCTQPGCDKVNQPYSRPQDLGRHLWFAHQIRGKHSHANKKLKLIRRTKIHVEAAPTYSETDLQLEGYAAFTAGEIYATVRQKAEAVGLPYTTFASRVYEFVRATSNGKQLGRAHSVPVLSDKAAA